MILALFTLDSVKHGKAFDVFFRITQERYHAFLSQPLTAFAGNTWYSAVKPYHAEAFPFLALDMLVHLRGLPCQLFFGHDLLEINSADTIRMIPRGNLHKSVSALIDSFPRSKSGLRFQGFGPRIDTSLNALSALYVDLLSSLTRVEADVIASLRRLQFEKFQTPTSAKTFGLQKQVALDLGKSPVAIHKSLRSAKFDLVSSTAIAMKQIMG